MSVELGSIGTAVGSTASSIGKAGAGLGEVMKAPIGNIINEGPARGGFLGGEILFQAKLPNVPNVIQQAESVAAAAWSKSALPVVSEPEIVHLVARPAEIFMPKIEPAVMPFTSPAPKILEYAQPQPQLQTRTENRVSVLLQPLPAEQEAKEIVEEKVKKQKPEERLEEAEEIESQMYLEDENVSAQRRIEIRRAIVEARIEADKLGLKKITGWMVAKLLPNEHEGNRSQVIKKQGPDGSYQETVEEISGTGELESQEQAMRRFNNIVAEKKPVKYGKDGTPVEGKDIARVLKYRIFKSVQPHEEVIKRVAKKKEHFLQD